MGARADICVVVEGCYPYVTGGVSSWLHWLMTNLRDYRFAVTALVAEKKEAGERRYELPENVIDYRDAVLLDFAELEEAQRLRLSRRQWRALQEALLRIMDEWKTGSLSPQSLALIRRIVETDGARLLKNFLDDEGAFEVLTRLYDTRRPGVGFVNYYYTARNIHLVLYKALLLVKQLPRARVYHAPSTGFAGFLACLAAQLHGARSMITEHGIYVQEREMELLRAGWLDEAYQKEMWIRTYQALCTWQYHQCDRLVTLYHGNRQLEEGYGAPAGKALVVPNGIDVERFRPARRPRCVGRERTMGFVGRVTAVKDVKTFLQVVSLVRRVVGQVKAYVVGPHDEEPDYYRECLELARMLDLGDAVEFTGPGDVLSYYSRFDLLVLTSIKEAMPLAVMEAMASGVPVVTTDVGACRELIDGMEDNFGPAGFVRRIMDVDALASACIKVLSDPELSRQLALAGVRRIETFYNEALVLDRYRSLYGELLRDVA
ncbi:Glycosyltransferase involved in cell wall bisynthesis [Desulfacinum hydrothermale DSM 13146]|uniref:Glycosyltransferase involved in cell wall bisynthesis n=1 Tax=Desulfacinum hydrothermale DSM 13146 TaxID=1121390 RepID=A0A1W1X8V4_9BACT|nr:GT4 family glycosyltransferase PelF [Desulfacinum hydrothermale]SMC20108.1 Glycosyltransferase involved in cell wall bisynthesis [Desulfacinum hydrothermale DSM 13146]